jgi:hypothetical protein
VPEPRTVIGTTVDTAGLPLPGARIWVETELYTGTPGLGVSDPEGRYRVERLIAQYVYTAYAWTEVDYRGRAWCLRLAPLTPPADAAFPGATGAVRDFRWRIAGPMEDTWAAPGEDGAYWGATARLFPDFADGAYDRVVELTLTPDGPLVDGTTGSTIVRAVDLATTPFALDIPLGAYVVTAARVEPDGSRLPLLVATEGSAPAPSALLEFAPQDTYGAPCGSAAITNGVERAFLDVVAR